MHTKPSINCQVLEITSLEADVYQLKLLLPENSQLSFKPGQYLMLAAENGDFYPFSIASAPQQLPQIELHILARNNAAVDLLEQLREVPQARVQLPLGNVQLNNSQQPTLLIAAGTGMAQMHSMLEFLRLQDNQARVDLYWGAKSAAEFYQVAAWQQWEQMPNVQLHKVVSHDPQWTGRSGMLYEAITSDINDFSDLQVFISGSPNMVYTTLDAFMDAGMRKEQMQADVFSYAPR